MTLTSPPLPPLPLPLPSPPRPRRARLTGLDGLRAIAVALVVVYHLFPGGPLRQGFIGVDVFFVISGFLITTLLLREHADTGRIALVPFWRRRARRLLPALAVVVTVCASVAWITGGDVLVRLGAQILGAATFGYNWVSIAAGSQYFSATTPELFRNLWSLAVEEQFYVLWPLILPLFLLIPRGWMRATLACALAAASASWMAGVVVSGGDVTRAYFGTDTHAFGLLLGVALAFVLRSAMESPSRNSALVAAAPVAAPAARLAGDWTVVARPRDTGVIESHHAWMHAPQWRHIAGVVGFASVVALVLLATSAPLDGPAAFPGVLLTASMLAVAAIVAGLWPGSWFGRAIDIAPLRWIGDRSYGIYLWHWPILVLLTAAVPEFSTVPTWVGLSALALTLVAAELSYRLVERPVRRYGFRGSLAMLGQHFAGTPAARLRAVIGVAAVAVLLGGTSAAIAAAPGVSSAEAVVDAGAAALRAASASPPVPSLTPSAAPAPAPAPDPPAAPSAIESPPPSPAPIPVTGAEITAVGDSVMLASAPSILAALPGAQIDAAVSRSMYAAPGILQALAASGQLRPYVVLALGTNGPVNSRTLDQIVTVIGPERHLILVNAAAPRSWIPGVNNELASFAATHPDVSVADWSGAIAGQEKLLAGDRIHPGAGGGRIFASVILSAAQQVQQQRADQQYDHDLRSWRLSHGIVPPVPQ